MARCGVRYAEYMKLEQTYEIKETLGRGTFAQVYRAVHRITGEVYAVKEVNKSQLDDETKVQMKMELAVLLEVSKHPGIVTLYDKFECEEYIWFVMEYVDGGMLLNRLSEKGSFSENDARMTMISTLRSLEFLSELGVVHRDIKPENILFDSKSQEWPTRLTDFGLSAKIDKNVLLYAACGTPAFCSPEVLQDRGYDCACDMWSFGIVLYIVLAGYPPFDKETPEEAYKAIIDGSFSFPEQEWSNISEEAKDIVRRILVVDPKKRVTAKEALRHPWFSMKQSTSSLPNNKLKSFNVKRNMRIRFLAVKSANSFLSFKDRPRRRDPRALQAEVERTRILIEQIEASEAVKVSTSLRASGVRRADADAKRDMKSQVGSVIPPFLAQEQTEPMVKTSSPITPEPRTVGSDVDKRSNGQVMSGTNSLLTESFVAQPPLEQPSLRQPSGHSPLAQPTLGQSSFEQVSLGQTSSTQPSLSQPSIAQPPLRRRRRSLILPTVDVIPETTPSSTIEGGHRANAPAVGDTVPAEVAVLRKAEALLSHLDPPGQSDGLPRSGSRHNNSRQHPARRDEAIRLGDIATTKSKCECIEMQGSQPETIGGPHLASRANGVPPKRSIRPKLRKIDLTKLSVS